MDEKLVTLEKFARYDEKIKSYISDAIANADLGGTDTSDATATEDKVFLDETFYAGGAKKTGTFSLDEEMTTQDGLISSIRTALQGKASGGGGTVEDLTALLNEQEELISTLQETLRTKANGTGGISTPTQEKTVEIKENGTVEVIPDEGYALSKVTANVNVPTSGGDGCNELPIGHKRADFIQFTGKQLVDTGIIGNQDTQINVSFTWESATQNHVFGCASSDNTASITSYTNGSWRFGNKYQTKNMSSKNPKLPYSALVNKSTISLPSAVSSISGVNDFETVGTLLVGGARSAGGGLPSSSIVGKIFYFILWESEILVMKLVPVVSAEGRYRFFDMVSKTFFDSITETPLEGGII